MALAHDAARDGDLPELARLLRADARAVRRPDELGRTPLHWAALRGHRLAVEWLLLNGANPDARDRDGFTPYGLAVQGEPDADRRAAERKAAESSSWPYPQVWRWPFGRALRAALFLLFLAVAVFGLVLVRPGALGPNWNTVEVLSEPRLFGDYASKPLVAMAGSGDTLAVLTDAGDVYLLDTDTKLSRTLCRGVADLTADDTGTLWLLRKDGGIDRASPRLVGGFALTAWQPLAERFWKTAPFKSPDVLATDLDDTGWLLVAPGGVAKYRTNADGSKRQRSWQTGDLSSFPTKYAVAVAGGAWLTGAAGGARFADGGTLNSVPSRELRTAEIAVFNAGHAEPWASAVGTDGRLWVHPRLDTGWAGPLFAPNDSQGLPSPDISATLLHDGNLFLGSANGLCVYDRRERRFLPLGGAPVDRLLPLANGGALWVGGGLRYVPPDARGERDVSTVDRDAVTADASAGGLCVYSATGTGPLPDFRAANPTNAIAPIDLATNLGWTKAAPAFDVVAVLPFAGETLVVTSAGAVRYDPAHRRYRDHSKADTGFLRFRAAARAGDDVLAVAESGVVYRTTPDAPDAAPWVKVDLGTFQAEKLVGIGASAFAVGTDAGVRGLMVTVGEAKPIAIAARRGDGTVSLSNRPAVADLHASPDGPFRLTIAGEIQAGKLPVVSYDSTASETAVASVPWADAAPPKQLRWHPAAGLMVLHVDGHVSDAAGKAVFGKGSSPLKPTDGTAIAGTSTGAILGGTGGRVADYDWTRGGWADRPALPTEEAVLEVGARGGTAFARTATGVWCHSGGPWQRHRDVTRWVIGNDQQEAKSWLVGPDGARPTAGNPDPAARFDRATAVGLPAFLAKSRHAWRPDPATGDWIAFTDTSLIGRYTAATDTWAEQSLGTFSKLEAVVPAAGGVALKTDEGPLFLGADGKTVEISRDFARAGDTLAATPNGEIAAATGDPVNGYLLARQWRRGVGREPPFVATVRADRAADPVPPRDFNVVAAAPTDAGLLLLGADGRAIEYNPDRGAWVPVFQPDGGEQLVGWFDAPRFQVVTKRDGLFRLIAFGPDAAGADVLKTDRHPDQWSDAVRAALPAVAPPVGWFHRRAKALNPDHDRRGGFALAGGLLNPARDWHRAALDAPLKIRTGGPFGWVRGTGVEVSKGENGTVAFRLSDGKATRPLTPRPFGGFAEDRFARLGVGPVGELWGIQTEPRQLVRLFLRNGGLARDLTTQPIPLPEQLDPITAPDGRLEFRDPSRPGVYWAVVENALRASPGRHAPPLPAVPVGDTVLKFERVGFDGATSRLAAHLESGVARRPAWTDAGRPTWCATADCATVGNAVLCATPAGLVVRSRATFAASRLIPTDSAASFVRDGNGELLRIDIGAESFEWADGTQPLKKVARDAVVRTLKTGPWEWTVRHLAPGARRVEAIRDAGGRKRVEAELPGGRWAFADDRVNWLCKPPDGADVLLATDDGVWPVAFDGATFLGRGAVKLPGERVTRLRCAAGPTWGKFDGTNWSAVQRDTLAPAAGAAVPVIEAAIPKHPAWSGTLLDGALTLTAADGAERPAFEQGQPYFDRLDGLATVAGRLFTLSAGRAVVERDASNPATVLAVRPLPADLPAGWPHQLEPTDDALVLTAKKPDADEWRAWRRDLTAEKWSAVPAADVPAARVAAETGAFQWRAKSVSGPRVPELNPARAGEGVWVNPERPANWWWHDDRFAWDAVTAAAALDDATALLVSAAGPMTVKVADGVGTVDKVWPGVGFKSAEAARLPDGRKAGVFVGAEGGARVYFDAATRLPALPPDGAAPRESVVIVGPTADGIDFAARWLPVPQRRLASALSAVGLGDDSLISNGQFAFDRAATACPLPSAPDRWATVTPDGLVCVFDIPPAGPVKLRSVVSSKVANVGAMRAASADGVFLLVVPDPNERVRFERAAVWVPLVPGAKPPAGNVGRDLFRNGSRVTVDPTRLLWTRTDRFLTDGQPAVPRHDSGREVFAATDSGMSVAADVATSLAVVRRPTGLELSVLTRGGVLWTTSTDTDGDTALSFPNVSAAAVPGTANRVRYGPTGEAWVTAADGTSAKWVKDDWRVVFGGAEEVWNVAGRRVTFPSAGGVRVNGVTVTASNNSWRAWQRPFGAVIDAYPRGDVIWAATRENGVFKIHPDRLVPE